MDVSEVVRLSSWFDLHAPTVLSKYAALVNVLQNNAQQQSQQPVTEPLTVLSDELASMPTMELSALQLRILDGLGVGELIGERGRKWLYNKVRSVTYDPATTFLVVSAASQKISDASAKLHQFASAAHSVGFSDPPPAKQEAPFAITVIFQGAASIDNVRDLKVAAADWELILSGVAAVVGEKSENIEVIGASRGSIILTLGASALVTKILATISKHVASIANDYLNFQLRKEELERSRMMSQTIREDLDRQEGERRASSKQQIVEAVRALAPDALPDSMAKLERAIDKQIAFTEKGGEVDFITPRPEDDNVERDIVDFAEAFAEVRAIVEQYRAEKQQTKLLAQRVDDDSSEE